MNRIFILVLFISQSIISQNIIVDDSRSAQNLVEEVMLGNSGCAMVSNFVISGGNFGTGENSYGYFNNNDSIFPFEEGLILSTGKANDAIGPNIFEVGAQIPDWEGFQNDGVIANILHSTNTFNATSLEFDFISFANFISFEYIFASEEYTVAFMCNFSDIFGFFIKEASQLDDKYVNIALLPNRNTTISVTNVHPEGFCPAINEQFFNGFNPFSYPTNYNGQTIPLRAIGEVVPGVTYHIKLIIADSGDDRYDSAVFLKAGSFNLDISLGDDRLIENNNAICNEQGIVLNAGTSLGVQWFKSGDILLNETGQFLNVTPLLGSGVYSVTVDLIGCQMEDEIEIEFGIMPNVENVTIESCRMPDINNSVFNLTDPELINTLTLGNSNSYVEGFYETLIDYQNGILNDVIVNISFFETNSNQIIFVKVFNDTGCYKVAELDLQVLEYPEIKEDEIAFYCLNEFPVEMILESGLLNANTVDYEVDWYKDEILLGSEHNKEIIEINAIGIYQIKITNSNNCSVKRTITILPSETPTFKNVLVTENKFYKKVSIIVEVTGQGDYEYGIDNDENYQNENYFDNISYGLHTVYIRDKNGCGMVEEEILLLEYPKFITPNNDGVYDTWNINNINAIGNNFNTISNITIFDRYGKVMANINPNGLGWDGNYLGNPVPSSDYWFSLDLIDFNGKIITKKGHFALQTN